MAIAPKASAATNPSGTMSQDMTRGMKHGPMCRERPVITAIPIEVIQINVMSLKIQTRKMMDIFNIRITHPMCGQIIARTFHTIIKMISVLITCILRYSLIL